MALHANRSRAAAEQLAGEIAGQGGRARVVLADLADPRQRAQSDPGGRAPSARSRCWSTAPAEFEPDEIESLARARFERTFAVNLAAPLFLAQAFAAQAPAGASIVNVVDQRVFKPTPRFLSYTLSKSALHMATTTLAQALAPRVRVNAVAPGPTLPSPRQTPSPVHRAGRSLPLQHGPSPEDIAAAVLYLAGAAERHRRHHRGRRRPASRLAHARQRRRGVARHALSYRSFRRARVSVRARNPEARS